MKYIHFLGPVVALCAAQSCVAQTMEKVDKPYPKSTLPVASAAQSEGKDMSLPIAMRWEVRTSDVTISKTFERWAAMAGYRLKWDAQKNFLVGAPDVIEGSFEEAVAQVLSSPGIGASDYPLEACFYANTPPLMRITRQGAQAADCAAQQ